VGTERTDGRTLSALEVSRRSAI